MRGIFGIAAHKARIPIAPGFSVHARRVAHQAVASVKLDRAIPVKNVVMTRTLQNPEPGAMLRWVGLEDCARLGAIDIVVFCGADQ
jgi:hypothetical protein